MDTVAGVYFPRGGMRALPDALAAAAEAAGVTFRYGSPVTALERAGSRVTAVRTADGRAHRLRRRRARHRAGHGLPAARAGAAAPGRAAAVAVRGRAARRRRARQWPAAAHHTIAFGGAWRETFREIIDQGQPMSDPSLLVTRPTATDPGLAPPGRDLLYVLAPAPNLVASPDSPGQADWDAAAGQLRRPADRDRGGPGAARPGRRRRDPAGGHPGRLGPPGPGRRAPRSPTRTPSGRPGRSGRATCPAAPRTPCWPGAAPCRGWACPPR